MQRPGPRRAHNSCQEGAEATGGFEVADVFPFIKILQVISGMRPKLEKIHRKIDMILDNIVKEHNASKEEAENTGKDKANDLLGVLLNLQEHGELEVPLTMNNIKAVLLDIFTAESETSSSTVEWAMSEMLKTPRVMRKAQAEVRQVFFTKGNVEETCLGELKFLKAVIKETLRVRTLLFICCFQKNVIKVVRLMDMGYLLKPKSL